MVKYCTLRPSKAKFLFFFTVLQGHDLVNLDLKPKSIRQQEYPVINKNMNSSIGANFNPVSTRVPLPQHCSSNHPSLHSPQMPASV